MKSQLNRTFLKAWMLLTYVSVISGFDLYKIVIPEGGNRCFFDELFEKTFVRLEATSTSKMSAELKKPGEHKIFFGNTLELHQTFFTNETGNFEFCFINNSEGKLVIELEYTTGLEAKDFGALIKDKDVKPLDNKVKFNK